MKLKTRQAVWCWRQLGDPSVKPGPNLAGLAFRPHPAPHNYLSSTWGPFSWCKPFNRKEKEKKISFFWRKQKKDGCQGIWWFARAKSKAHITEDPGINLLYLLCVFNIKWCCCCYQSNWASRKQWEINIPCRLIMTYHFVKWNATAWWQLMPFVLGGDILCSVSHIMHS